ncbi:hybrid sensor histidine kinase/response regulator, partial [Rugamonas sp. FT82W]
AQAASAPAASATPAATQTPPPPAALPASQPADATAFNMDSLMRVMGKDAKGRAVMVKMVRDLVDTGMEPADQAGQALREGRLRDAARQFHSLRGAVGVLGAKRLIQATVEAETAINDQRDELLEARYQAVRAELEQTLALARDWLAGQ